MLGWFTREELPDLELAGADLKIAVLLDL
jgi:hypothetical protein